MRIKPDGKVGIGSTSPSTPLYVVGTITASEGNIILNQADFGSKFSITSQGPLVGFLGGSPFFLAITYNSAGSAVVANSSFTHDSSGVLSIRHGSASTQFRPARLSIKADGTVGIGTEAPSSSYKLDVVGSIRTSATLSASSIASATGNFSGAVGMGALTGTTATFTKSSGATKLRLFSGNNDPYISFGDNNTNWAVGVDRSDSGAFKISNTSGVPGTSDKITVLTDGNVGIGTAAPGAYKLYVNGSSFVNGELSAGTDLIATQDVQVGGDIDLPNGSILDKSNATGTNGQALLADGNGQVEWGNGSATVADGAVTTAKIATDAVTQSKIADGAVGAAQLVSYSVTVGKVASNSVNADALIDNSVGADALAGWRAYTVVWGTSQTGITYVSATVLRIAHGLGTKFIIHSILDASGTVAAAANSYVDVNHYADVYAKYIDDNTTDFIFAGNRTNGQTFRFAMLGH
jgi:hypothetical protein